MVKIRKFREGDEVRMRQIAPKAFATYARFGIDKTLPRDKVRLRYRIEVENFARRMMKGDPNLHILVADEDGLVQGYIVVGVNEDVSRIFGFKFGSIVSLAVDPKAHGRGIGNKLIARGLAWLKRAGVRYVQVVTDQNNIAAIRAYEKNGFRVIHCSLTLSQYL